MANDSDAVPVTSQDAPAASQAELDEAREEAELEAEVRICLEID